MPVVGAAVSGIMYEAVYEAAAGEKERARNLLCYGMECYAPTFWAIAISILIACGLWVWSWQGLFGWKRKDIAV
jgi:chromate transport protein ChrA